MCILTSGEHFSPSGDESLLSSVDGRWNVLQYSVPGILVTEINTVVNCRGFGLICEFFTGHKNYLSRKLPCCNHPKSPLLVLGTMVWPEVLEITGITYSG